ncbi:glycoside hydrolase family 10 protein [Mucilaginibacter flavus]|uniref:glycoside hydrolase family 10 protein n=1 Tax=Mucilaginibacter flavus TaxID=931504 RepID=UPI0025B3069E|nr:family 10 glycosylhydrolase [Mucilaginibacter flavus]MDN3582197.1 family 10 glycosylhydrolase [Mucilaginibacter flavus]
MSKIYLVLVVVLVGAINASFAQQSKSPKREFRGVWVASVENIDWPTKPGESTDQQKKELIDLLDAHHAAGINAIMLQIRPAADAFYAKSREPWSKWLTGKQGLAPDPMYDPLEFAIQEAHKRGMELHAWFNPYRATKDNDYASLSPHHITNIHPEWFFEYGGQKLFNPGLPEVQEYIIRVVLDVVDNYDIDGVHMDDYFYPYHVAGQQLSDQLTYAKYGAGFSDIKDWRRDNVNRLVKALGDSIHAHNPRLKYGMSPFSIWANKYQNPEGSDTHGGDSYYELYADSRKWVQEGWVDYINPQLYRPLNDKLVAFNIMIDWWANQVNNRHIYIGQAPYRIIENKLPAFRQPAELPNEIKYLRNNARIQGSVYFSSKSLTANPLGFTDSLKNNYYHYPALPPVMLWLDSVAPMPPVNLTASTGPTGINLKWQQPAMAKDSEAVYGYLIYRFDENTRINTDDPKNILSIRYDDAIEYEDKTAQNGKSYIYVVTAIDRLKNESDRSNSVLIKASVTDKPNEQVNQ